jgi:hypothetical protein
MRSQHDYHRQAKLNRCFENDDVMQGEADSTLYVYNKCKRLKSLFLHLPSATLTEYSERLIFHMNFVFRVGVLFSACGECQVNVLW